MSNFDDERRQIEEIRTMAAGLDELAHSIMAEIGDEEWDQYNRLLDKIDDLLAEEDCNASSLSLALTTALSNTLVMVADEVEKMIERLEGQEAQPKQLAKVYEFPKR